MDSGEVCRVGRWLKFKAGTCFGDNKDHLGIFVAISNDQAICIAVNATSNVEGVKEFAERRHISPLETIVVILPDTPEASYHFGRETAFDCNRPSVVGSGDLARWVERRMVELVDYNVEVDGRLLERIRDGILKSPLVPEKHKRIIRAELSKFV